MVHDRRYGLLAKKLKMGYMHNNLLLDCGDEGGPISKRREPNTDADRRKVRCRGSYKIRDHQ